MVNKIDLFPFYIDLCVNSASGIAQGYTDLCTRLVRSQKQALDKELGGYEYPGSPVYRKSFSYYEATGVVLSESSIKVTFYGLCNTAVGFDMITMRGREIGNFVFKGITEDLALVIRDRKRKIATDEIDRIDREEAKRIRDKRVSDMMFKLFGERP